MNSGMPTPKANLFRGAMSVAVLLLSACLARAQNFFPLQDVRPGLRGIGRTVFQGDRIEEFQVVILGVLENVGPKQAIILAKLSGGPLEHAGVLQGMSGSPVYVDGKLKITLRGDRIVPEFIEILDAYVDSHYGVAVTTP